MRLVNLTKYPLTLCDTNGEAIEIPSDPRHVAIAGMGEHRAVDDGDGHTFSLNVRHVREVKGMPEPEEGTLFIVPVEVAMVLQEQREDVAFPAEEAAVRDGDGRLRRVTHLRRVVMGMRSAARDEQPEQTAGAVPLSDR